MNVKSGSIKLSLSGKKIARKAGIYAKGSFVLQLSPSKGQYLTSSSIGPSIITLMVSLKTFLITSPSFPKLNNVNKASPLKYIVNILIGKIDTRKLLSYTFKPKPNVVI